MDIGDIIRVIRIRQFARDDRLPARVIEIAKDKFAVELLHGDFGEPGCNRLWLEDRSKGRAWE